MYQSPLAASQSASTRDAETSLIGPQKMNQRQSILPAVEIVASSPLSMSDNPHASDPPPLRPRRSFRTVVVHDVSPRSSPQQRNLQTTPSKRGSSAAESLKGLGIVAPSLIRVGTTNNSNPSDAPHPTINSPPLKPSETSMKARTPARGQRESHAAGSSIGFRSFSSRVFSPSSLDETHYSLFQSITGQLQQRNAEIVSGSSGGLLSSTSGNGMVLVKRTSMSQLKRADSMFSASSVVDEMNSVKQLPAKKQSATSKRASHAARGSNPMSESDRGGHTSNAAAHLSSSTLSSPDGSSSDADSEVCDLDVASVGTNGSVQQLASTRTYESHGRMKNGQSMQPTEATAPEQGEALCPDKETFRSASPPKAPPQHATGTTSSTALLTRHQQVRQRITEAARRRQEEAQRQLDRTREKTELAQTKKVLAEKTRSSVVSQAWWTIFTVTNCAAKIHDLVMRKKAMRFLMFRLLPRVRIKVRRLRCAKAIKARVEAEGGNRLPRPTTKMLRSDELLWLFPEDVLFELLPKMQARFYFKNDVVCYQGSAGAEAYIIAEGEGLSTVYQHSRSKRKSDGPDGEDEHHDTQGIRRVDSMDSLSSVATTRSNTALLSPLSNSPSRNATVAKANGNAAPGAYANANNNNKAQTIASSTNLKNSPRSNPTVATASFASVTSSKSAVEGTTRLKPGSVFGTPSLILGEKRMATFKATTDMVVWVVQREDFLACVAAGHNQDLLKRAMGMVRALHCSNISTLHSKAFSPEGLQKFEIFAKVDKAILQSLSDLTQKPDGSRRGSLVAVSTAVAPSNTAKGAVHNTASYDDDEDSSLAAAHGTFGEAPEPMLFQPGTELVSPQMRANTSYLLLSGSVDVTIRLPPFGKYSHALFYALRCFTELIQFTKRTNMIYIYDNVAAAVERRFKPLESVDIVISVPSPVLVGLGNMITGVRHGTSTAVAASSCDAIRIPREPFIKELLEDFQSLPGTKNYLRRNRLSFFPYWYLRATQLPRSEPHKLLPVKEASRQIYGGGIGGFGGASSPGGTDGEGATTNAVASSSPVNANTTVITVTSTSKGGYTAEPATAHSAATRVLSVYKNMSTLFTQPGQPGGGDGQHGTPIEPNTKPSAFSTNPRPLSPASAAAAAAIAQFNSNPFPNGLDELIVDKTLSDEAFVVVRGSFGPATGAKLSNYFASDDMIGLQPYMWPPLQQVFYGGYNGCSCKIPNPVTVVRIRRKDIHRALQTELDGENRSYLQAAIAECAAAEHGGVEPEVLPFVPAAALGGSPPRASGQSVTLSHHNASPTTATKSLPSTALSRSESPRRRPVPTGSSGQSDASGAMDSPLQRDLVVPSRVGKSQPSTTVGGRRVSFPTDNESINEASARGDYPESLMDRSLNAKGDSPQNLSIGISSSKGRATFDQTLLLRGNENDPRNRNMDWVPPANMTLGPHTTDTHFKQPKLLGAPPKLAVTAIALVAENTPTGAKTNSPQWTPRRKESYASPSQLGRDASTRASTTISGTKDRPSVIVDPKTNNVVAIVGHPSSPRNVQQHQVSSVLSGRRAGDGVFTYDTLTELLRDHVPSSSPYNLNNMAAAQRKALLEGSRPHYDMTDKLLKVPSKPKTKLTMKEAGEEMLQAKKKADEVKRRRIARQVAKREKEKDSYDLDNRSDEDMANKQQASATETMFDSQLLDDESSAKIGRSPAEERERDLVRQRAHAATKDREKLHEMMLDPHYRPVGELASLLCDIEGPNTRTEWVINHHVESTPTKTPRQEKNDKSPQTVPLRALKVSKISGALPTIADTRSPRNRSTASTAGNVGNDLKSSPSLSATHQRPVFVFGSPPSSSAISEAFLKGSPGAFAFKSNGPATRKKDLLPSSSRGISESEKTQLPAITTPRV